jgi:hypothetical protein
MFPVYPFGCGLDSGRVDVVAKVVRIVGDVLAE